METAPELPFAHAIVSHGEPVHLRAAYERALERERWRGWGAAGRR
jgi:hypothetical protein